MSAALRRNRPGVVLVVGVLIGAALVELGSFAATVPPAPPIVMVLKTTPVVEPLAAPPEVKAPLPAPVVLAAPVPMPVPAKSAKKVARAQPVLAMVAAPAPAPVKSALKVSRAVRVRRAALAPIPDGVVAGLRRSGEASTGAVARELVAGAGALERGTAYTAWSHFTRALALEHDNRDALMGVALCHYELNQKGAADRALSRLLSLDPTHPEASILRGFIAQLAGDVSGAIEWYERAIPRLEDDAVADELRSVINLLRPQLTLAPSATARAERTR